MIVFNATPFQERMERVPESFNLVCAGGRGGGKTWGTARLVIRHCQHPDARVLVTRKRLKSLQQFATELRRLSGAKYNTNDSMFTFPSGATVQLAHCESQAALLDIAQGFSYSMIVVDEAGSSPEMAIIDELMLALRSSTLPTRMVLLCNPGGANHAAIAERYVTSRSDGMPYELGGRTWVTLFSTVDDNPHLPAEYHRNFEQMRLSDPARYAAMRHGDWSALVGQYLQGCWSASRILAPQHVPPPEAFKSLKIGADWGTASPAPFLLGGRLAEDWYIDETDQFLVRDSWVLVDEHVEYDKNDYNRGTARMPFEISPALLAMCRRWRTRARGVIDSAANARTQGRHQSTVSEQFKANGVSLLPSRKRGTRADRCLELRDLMANREFFVSQRCAYWLATVPSLPRDERDPEVPDTNACDHAWDASLYLIGADQNAVRTGKWR